METTALHVAAEKGIEDIVSTLVRQGANVNVYDKVLKRNTFSSFLYKISLNTHQLRHL